MLVDAETIPRLHRPSLPSPSFALPTVNHNTSFSFSPSTPPLDRPLPHANVQGLAFPSLPFVCFVSVLYYRFVSIWLILCCPTRITCLCLSYCTLVSGTLGRKILLFLAIYYVPPGQGAVTINGFCATILSDVYVRAPYAWGMMRY